MSPSTSRAALASVIFAVVVLFAATTVSANVYHATRRNRAEQQYEAGLKLESAGRNSEAADDFRTALVYEHDQPEYRMALAKSLIALGDFDEAETHLTDLHEADPANGPVDFMLARIAVEEHADADAIEDYHRAIYGFWPDHAEQHHVEARFELIQVLERDHQQKQLLTELLELAGELPDSDVENRLKVASLLLSHGSPEHAAEEFGGIATAHPSNAAAQQGLGEARFQLGDFLAARAAFHVAARIEPANAEIRQRIEECDMVIDLDPTLVRLSANQRFERAQELLRQSLNSAERCGAVSAAMSAEAAKAL
ncbi:MAG TPA: tetratricopeptide repeat protein, partial [Bryobacteraceae bacterium]|nr:tetratricopeptide repeat protein [Bryobacteraceae bacterium]